MLSHNRLLLAVSALGLAMTFASAEALVGKAEDAKKIVETQCAACHGVYGEGVAATPVQAKLGGQHENYLRIQLQALKASKDATGARFEITMAPQAGLLSDQDIANVAAYYSQQPLSYFKFEDDFKAKHEAASAELEQAKATLIEIEAKEKSLKEQLASDPDNAGLQKEVKALPRALRSAKSGVRRAESAIDQLNKDKAKGEALMVRGKQLYFGGDIAKRIPACVACHSPSGTGNGPAAYPVIAGQNYEYLVNQLENFRGSKRLNDPARMMRDIAERMSDAEIEAVSTYIKYMPSN